MSRRGFEVAEDAGVVADANLDVGAFAEAGTGVEWSVFVEGGADAGVGAEAFRIAKSMEMIDDGSVEEAKFATASTIVRHRFAEKATFDLEGVVRGFDGFTAH
jgi:hypothetical protein